MNKGYTEDQHTFREVVGRFLQDKSTTTEVRRLMETESGFNADVWQQLCGELGLAGTHLPEALGGFGFGPVELGIVCEEMGRALYGGPYFGSAVMAGYAVLFGAEGSETEKLLPDIASGSLIATLVLDSLDSPDSMGRSLSVEAGKLNGSAPLVIEAQNAACLIVLARSGSGWGLYRVSVDGQGVSVTPVEAMDMTRRLSRVDFNQAEAIQIGTPDETGIQRIWDHICVALAHEMIGGAQRLLDTTVDYTKVRYQFGRPIGSFQGLKHRCADLLMELEIAKALTRHAAYCLATGEGESWAASMAKAAASDVYLLAGREAIQMRGGIGFTWEEDTQLWFKRAKSSEVFMGTPVMHRERVITLMEEVEAA